MQPSPDWTRLRFKWSRRYPTYGKNAKICTDNDQLSGQSRKKPHTLQTVHSDIEEACQTLEAQIAEIEQENRRALAEVKDVVGALSELRHGRFAPSSSGENIGEEVMATLKQLEAVCDKPAG